MRLLQVAPVAREKAVLATARIETLHGFFDLYGKLITPNMNRVTSAIAKHLQVSFPLCRCKRYFNGSEALRVSGGQFRIIVEAFYATRPQKPRCITHSPTH